MIKKALWIAMMIAVCGAVPAAARQMDELNKKTVFTFNKAIEIPGQVLPAGTYTFRLVDSLSDRHIVQVFNADGSKLLGTVMTISNARLVATDKTVVRFSETPVGTPEALRAWFYPGNTIGQEFVYSKARAAELAKLSRNAVPALAADVAGPDDLKTVSIVAVTPDAKETAVSAAVQTPATPAASVQTPAPATLSARATSGRALPKTASPLPLIMLFGVASLGAALGLMMFGRRALAVSSR